MVIKQFEQSGFRVATKILRNKSNLQKHFMDYEKSTHFSNALKDSSVYVYQLHTSSLSRIGQQQDHVLHMREIFVEDLHRKSV